MRRNLLAEAQTQAAAQVAPQVAALSQALTQAKLDRNSAIHAAAAANAGIAHAIHLAGKTVHQAYGGAQSLAAPGQSYSGATYAGAAANERAVTGTALASSMSNALKELSDRRIEAAAGRAYSTHRAIADYGANVASVQSKQQSLAGQEGLYAASALSKLTESAAGRKNQRLMQQRSLSSQANLQGQRLTSQADLQSSRLASQEAVAGARLQSSEHTAALGRRQAKLGRIDQGKRQDKQIAAANHKAAVTATKAPSATTIKGRQAILAWKAAYDAKPHDMASVHAEARSKGVPDYVILAAANYSSKGYIAPREVQKLQQVGVDVPKEWQGTQIRAHTRKPRSK